MSWQQSNHTLSRVQLFAFTAGLLFLLAYWLFGFDGITFSDDVYYLLAGQKFWEGTMQVNDYHFSSRWGAYVPSGFIGYLLGFDAHKISLISLLSYGLTLLLILKILPKKAPSWVLVLWFCTQVYFLHFLTKVYPDSSLVLWTCLVPISAVYRKSNPVVAGCVLVAALFLGFLTKETIVLLGPFPIILFYLDWKKQNLNKSFYAAILATGILLSVAYLSYFWIKFGDPLHRVTTINAGHYISEFTYADKGFWSILKRLTILPIITFVERSYWAWMVFAIPGIALGLKSKTTPTFEFSLALLCLLIGFWFMTSTLDFYNPIYLNPRHLIILVPILSVLIALGWNKWKYSTKWRFGIIGLLGFGVAISLLQMDWKMAGFQLALFAAAYMYNYKFQHLLISVILLAPAIIAIPYQRKLKQYNNMTETLSSELQITTNQSFIVTNNFLVFSEEVLFPGDKINQKKLNGLDSLLTWRNAKTDTVTLLLYTYYHHAYPQEQEEIDTTELKLKSLGYFLYKEENEGLLWKRVYVGMEK
ncbi:4-amino-4-deoxy-L-arabinose transferase [Algoriphagus locisalis]|uniref:4-amino-4-deoxy-L-arabinose transferase n=1 Tax=Algoriphagus locisalis TaxID=305507 RepID=A0A1I6YG57_9BACT|nr:hypothetical protein [Algoriphagus locisalis]SFT49331.1 4-amino-4-deoxy-L-arabinose transferase [Algoriphagus locisalis]